MAAATTASAGVEAGSFRVSVEPGVLTQPYSGRVYVTLARAAKPEPRVVMWSWFTPPQVLAVDVADLKAGEPVVIDGAALSFPAGNPKEIPAGTYFAQAVVRLNPDSPLPGQGAGDLYSDVVEVNYSPETGAAAELRLSNGVEVRPLRETERLKVVEVRSELLSAFYGREVKTRAGVLLPKDWRDDASARYPTLYSITGFGGDHQHIRFMERVFEQGGSTDGIILVVPDPLCMTGHSVFADSANNGPRGESLIKELIPAIEEKFHGARDGDLRFVTGVSSGGWSSLWLQVTYPDQFSGCWAHCPDPVDFRDFQRIDLYAPGANMYRDAEGERRQVSRGNGGTPGLFYDEFVRQETVMGPGGQISSFEAVFSPRGADGKPVPLFDRATGNVNPETAKAWEKYDLRLVMERGWQTLAPKLAGKVHVYAGGSDTYYLEGAAKLLKESLEGLKSDAEVKIVPGMPHTLYMPAVGPMMEEIRAKGMRQAPHEGP